MFAIVKNMQTAEYGMNSMYDLSTGQNKIILTKFHVSEFSYTQTAVNIKKFTNVYAMIKNM